MGFEVFNRIDKTQTVTVKITVVRSIILLNKDLNSYSADKPD